MSASALQARLPVEQPAPATDTPTLGRDAADADPLRDLARADRSAHDPGQTFLFEFHDDDEIDLHPDTE